MPEGRVTNLSRDHAILAISIDQAMIPVIPEVKIHCIDIRTNPKHAAEHLEII